MSPAPQVTQPCTPAPPPTPHSGGRQHSPVGRGIGLEGEHHLHIHLHCTCTWICNCNRTCTCIFPYIYIFTATKTRRFSNFVRLWTSSSKTLQFNPISIVIFENEPISPRLLHSNSIYDDRFVFPILERTNVDLP